MACHHFEIFTLTLVGTDGVVGRGPGDQVVLVGVQHLSLVSNWMVD